MVGFIGSGNMAGALARGWGDPILATDHGSGRAQALVEELGGEVVSNQECAQRADVLILAHKPYQLAEVARTIAPQGIVVSILGSTPLADLEDAYPDAEVYRALGLRNEAALVTRERIGTFEYLVAATPLTVRQLGILTVPLASRQREIDQQIDHPGLARLLAADHRPAIAPAIQAGRPLGPLVQVQIGAKERARHQHHRQERGDRGERDQLSPSQPCTGAWRLRH